MKATWRGLLLVLLFAEALLLLNLALIQPQCEVGLPGVPCGPRISGEQEMLAMIMVLLPVRVLIVQTLRIFHMRSAS